MKLIIWKKQYWDYKGMQSFDSTSQAIQTDKIDFFSYVFIGYD